MNNNANPDVRPSLLAELLLYHSVLGRGYVSPFPVTKGLVFTSALPQESLFALATAEGHFRRWHEEQIENDRQLLAQLEAEKGGAMSAVTGGEKRIKELKERVTRRPNVTWKEDDVIKSTLVELLKTHFYGAFTYLDAVGSRLASSLSHSTKLAKDLGWYTLTEGTTDEAFIRASGTGGANIHSLAGTSPIFNYFCNCMEQHVEKLREKIKDTTGGHVGIGRCVLIPGRPSISSGVSADVLGSLLRRVFTLGEQDPEKRVKVVFTADSEMGWREFFSWNLPQVLDEDIPPAWQWKLAETSPTSPKLAVLFGARASLVGAFIEHASTNPHAAIKQVELDQKHLDLAKAMARMIYAGACGQAGMSKRIGNLNTGAANYTTPQLLAVARESLTDAIKTSEGLRVSRGHVRKKVQGCGLAQLDELVKDGEFYELKGAEECQMGQVRTAYCLPKDAPTACDLGEDAFVAFDEACEIHAEAPKATRDSMAIKVAMTLREKAAETYNDHFAPVVALSRMSTQEIRALPRVLEMYPESFLMRGREQKLAEPQKVLEDEDMPVDRDGANLWVRCRPNGEDFCDWSKSSFLEMGQWAKEEKREPEIVTA